MSTTYEVQIIRQNGGHLYNRFYFDVPVVGFVKGQHFFVQGVGPVEILDVQISLGDHFCRTQVYIADNPAP